MHVGLSTARASALRLRFVGLRGTRVRLLHSSARLRTMGNPWDAPPEWLRRVMDDDVDGPPWLYAWTPKNLSPAAEAASQPDRGSQTGSEARPLAGAKERQRTLESQRARARAPHTNSNEPPRVHILGVGNMGRLYAMCLSKLADGPRITLVVRTKELLERWAAEPGIELTRHGHVHRSAGFDIEWWTTERPPVGPIAEVGAGRRIDNLIVATKARDALPQVDRVRRYLDSGSTVVFVQNGMCKLWPPLGDAYVQARFPNGTSPNWIACVTTHGVTSQGPFKSTHASPANALVGPVMRGDAGSVGEESMGYLMRQIASAPDLDARQVSRMELWTAQLEKLVVNAVINPLTAVLRCKNGEILEARDDALPAVIDRLLAEASDTLRAHIQDPKSDEILSSDPDAGTPIPEGSGGVPRPNADRKELLRRFSFPQLQRMVLDVGAKVSENKSSMLQDMIANKQTEIDEFNGWLVDTARLLDKGLRLPTHEKLIELVKTRAALTRRELCASLLGEAPC
ncbi:ketoisovalerate reductase [Xylaria palmicola]|nr:ketoisovalerate reductase [Xylaria palmicola]